MKARIDRKWLSHMFLPSPFVRDRRGHLFAYEGTPMKLIHEYDNHSWHRIVFKYGMEVHASEWVSHFTIATLVYNGRMFAATTAYHGLWNNAVVEIVNPDIEQELKS